MIILLTFVTCQPARAPREVETSFYFWRTRFQLDAVERQYLKALAVKRLYVRVFDVDWNEYENQAVPVGIISPSDKKPIDLPIIPTIFITNRTIKELPDNQVLDLAQKIKTKALSLAEAISSQKISEIQLDCDWSESTRAKYFLLLKAIESQGKDDKIQISATIRLHQFKYPQKTGVPPVSRGMLMFYNMGDVSDNRSQNSILDLKIAQQYLQNASAYTLPLDIALPIFAWGVLSRRHRVIHLLPNLQASDLQDITRYEVAKIGQYRVKKSHYLQGVYVYQGDLIRLEGVEKSQLLQATKQLQNLALPASLRLSFYHLDSHLLRKFSSEDLEQIRHHLR
jgi:hypothetical protein